MRTGWTLALCGLLHALGKHQAFQKPWLCQRQARKPNPLPQARTKTLQKVKYFAMHFSAVGKYQRGRSPGCICEKEKKKKIKKKIEEAPKEAAKLELQSQTHNQPRQWQPISQTQHVHSSPVASLDYLA